MRSFSDQFLVMLPALLALLLLALFSAPMRAGDLALVPNIGWIMTLVVAFSYPPSWPRWFAFMLGLLQDVLFSTPLGAQALLTLLLLQLVSAQARRQSFQRFRVRWLEAAGVLVVWHGLLWVLCYFVTHNAPPLRTMLTAGLVSAAWYPLFYWVLEKLGAAMPPRK